MTTTFRTHFTFRVDTWTPDGESIVEHVAGVDDYQVALATFHALPNGSKVQSYGTNPKGIVVFDVKGRFFLMFARPDLPKIASNAPATATFEEAKDLLSGSIAYFGTYGVNDADKVINLRLEASTFPNQLASDQNGTITSLTADELHYEMTALAGGTISIVLRREALGCGRARDWNAVVPRAFSPHEL